MERTPKDLSELEWIQKASSLREAIELAGTSRQENGKLFSHQRWLNEEAAQRGINAFLTHVDDIAAVKEFDPLLHLVDALVSHI